MPPQNNTNHSPIFFDESRRRWMWLRRLGLSALAVTLTALIILAVSVIALPLLPHRPLPKLREALDAGNAEPALTDRQQARQRFALRRDERRLKQEIARDHRAAARFVGPAVPTVSVPTNGPIVAGFYVNWEETSRASLFRNIDSLTHFLPEWLHLNHDGSGFTDAREAEDHASVEPLVRAHNLPILPIVNNFLPVPGTKQSRWDTAALHALLTDSGRRATFIVSLRDLLIAQKWQGVNIDFEQVAPEDRDALTAFMAELSAAFRPVGLLVTQDVQLEDEAFNLPALARSCDFLIPMLYDEHAAGADGGGAGPIASMPWTRRKLRDLFREVPADKVVLGLGNYAYDWKKGELNAASLNFQSAMIQAQESRDPSNPEVARVKTESPSLNPSYRYFDDDGAEHEVWMLDAVTAYNQWAEARPYHPRGTALWYLGGEDPDVWKVLGRGSIAGDIGRDVDAGVLDAISYGKSSQVDFEGEGELLTVVAEPQDGRRTVRRDPQTGLITSEEYTAYPSSYVVRRAGYKPKTLVLTFDDGPDPEYTPQILDILKREGVKATFFVVGSQAESHPDLLRRMWAEGHEIGDHTWTHPDLGRSGESRARLEIGLTQRVIEAITGHTTSLFRPPYAIDVEPRTADELKPIILASKYNFVTVSEQIDPRDWDSTHLNPDPDRAADEIVENAWHDRDLGSVILLHDAGGDRTATIKALPKLIARLKSAGYTFSTIAELRGVSREAMFPPVTGREDRLVGVDRWAFEGYYWGGRVLAFLFTLSILLGVSRQAVVAVMALIQWRRERQRNLALAVLPGPLPSVSVVIAAYNEEKVIDRTIRAVLDSTHPVAQVIVVDDGSRDATSEVVEREFGDDLRVLSIRKENGGKASALNVGIAQATGDVIVGLDADTLFTPDTIARLSRHFLDPCVGAVAGNVRVGNARSILTRWQALEYTTSQNFDRRAYDLLNCITVVPGAVGAWRREAILEADGYEADTLAEDADLTWKVRRAGWRVENDSTAYAYTEAPESLRNLAKQRYRWAFGTLQNLWKHRQALGRHGAFGWFALPSLWLYQILFPALSPIMDAAVVVALFSGNLVHVAGYYLLMVGAEFLGAALAIWMDKGDWRLLPGLFLQRFVYRQMMYWVILKSLMSALRGGAVGWNKFERRGTATVGESAPPARSAA